MSLNTQELATILAALRQWQTLLRGVPEHVLTGIKAAWPQFDETQPLNYEQVGDLCEKLNAAESGAPLYRYWVLHEHEYGETVYLLESAERLCHKRPDQDRVALALDINYEPDKGDELRWFDATARVDARLTAENKAA